MLIINLVLSAKSESFFLRARVFEAEALFFKLVGCAFKGCNNSEHQGKSK